MSCSDLAGLEQAPDSIPESPEGLSNARGNLYGHDALVLSLLGLGIGRSLSLQEEPLLWLIVPVWKLSSESTELLLL